MGAVLYMYMVSWLSPKIPPTSHIGSVSCDCVVSEDSEDTVGYLDVSQPEISNSVKTLIYDG